MSISTHKAEVFRIDKLEPHPNADSLDLIYKDGFTIISQRGTFKVGDLAVHVQPESVVDISLPHFLFLEKPIVKPKKLRGILSMGFLLPAPPDSQAGDDLAERLGISHYEPGADNEDGNSVSGPPIVCPKYDIENIRKYNTLFNDGELVCVTCKINGENSRYVYTEKDGVGTMHVGSHGQWKKMDERCGWWKVLAKYPQIQTFCQNYSGWVIYGEKYGTIKNWKYGRVNVDFACFDIRKADGQWCGVDEWRTLCKQHDIPTVPIIVENFPFNFPQIEEFSNGPSLVEGADHNREGCVVKPMVERYDKKVGRIILKCVGSDYLQSKSHRMFNIITPQELAVLFHQTYERLAPEYGYETREETRQFDETSPNGKLMVAVCKELLQYLK